MAGTDYRIAYSRQNLLREAHVFREVDLAGRYDPGEFHRKMSRNLTSLGFQLADENLGIVRRSVADVGDVLGIMHGYSAVQVPDAGHAIYGLFKNRLTYPARIESHIKVSMYGETRGDSFSNLTVLITGRLMEVSLIDPKTNKRLAKAQSHSRSVLAENEAKRMAAATVSTVERLAEFAVGYTSN